ncbi:long-chain fatty acid--CoA ligase, partial [Mycobacterium sp. ITM-2017-0098]
LDGESVYRLMKDEGVTIMQGVPTVWMMLFAYLDEHPEIDARELGLEWAGIGGSALSQAMLARIESDLGAEGGQGWG